MIEIDGMYVERKWSNGDKKEQSDLSSNDQSDGEIEFIMKN